MITKQDAESLGWEGSEKDFTCQGGMWTLHLRAFGKTNNGRYPPNTDVIEIRPTYRMGNFDCFHGRCSDVETLKLLMDLLNINP